MLVLFIKSKKTHTLVKRISKFSWFLILNHYVLVLVIKPKQMLETTIKSNHPDLIKCKQ